MKGKSLFIIVATISLAWSLWSGALGACFEKIGGSESPSVLKIDKKSPVVQVAQRSFRKISVAIEKLSDNAFSMVGGPAFIQQCKDQPVLFGALFIFFGVSACGVVFIVHLIRTDSRLS